MDLVPREELEAAQQATVGLVGENEVGIRIPEAVQQETAKNVVLVPCHERELAFFKLSESWIFGV